MNLLYLSVFIVLVAILLLRFGSAIRNKEARMTWLSLLLACFAILTLGPVIEIQIIDAALGGVNNVWLAQCILATGAFWAFAEAAKSVDNPKRARLRSFLVPVLWCLAFSVPFLLDWNRSGTVEHFSRVYADNTGAYLSALIYMAGLCWMASGILRSSAGRKDLGHRLFVAGSVGVIIGCAYEALIMTADHFNISPIDWHSPAYFGFEITFYPGVILIAAGMGYFSLRKRRRKRYIQSRAEALRAILDVNDVPYRDEGVDDTYSVYALLILINDHRIIGNFSINADQTRTVEEAESWVENELPQLVEAAG